MRRLALLLLVAAVVGTAAAEAPAATEGKPCVAQAKRVTTFKRTMKTKRAAYFRKHRGAKARRAFVKKQKAKLKALQRAHAACLKRSKKQPRPAPPPAPQPQPPAPAPLPGDSAAPALAITSPADGSWSEEGQATLHGTAVDLMSGVAGVTCNGAAASLTITAFSCTVPLAEGANQVIVRARDHAGNEADASRVLHRRIGGLTGSPTAPAQAATADMLAGGAQSAPTDLTEGVIRVHLQVVFAADSTVEQVNRALQAVDGRIVASLDDSLIVVIRIPDPGSIAGLESSAAKLRAQPGVRAVHLSTATAPNVIPELIGATAMDELAHIDHHLAVRGAAAWNASPALAGQTAPTFLIGDAFGAVPSTTVYGVRVLQPTDFAAGAQDPQSVGYHGHHTLGIASAGFNSLGPGESIFREFATGIFPTSDSARIPVRAVDVLEFDGAALDTTLILRARQAADAGADVVVNTSMGFLCTTPAQVAANCNEITAIAQGSLWAKLVRDANLEGRMLHVASAGNVEVAGDTAASTNSKWIAAAKQPIIDPVTGQSTDPLSNVLVVEDQIATAPSPAAVVRPLCLAKTSKRPGDLSAIGTDVHSLTQSGAESLSGTSQAAPQVAGLAAYVWALDPTLSIGQLKARMLTTARPATTDPHTDCDPATSAPWIDAYGAILTADTGELDLPVRTAILDQNEDGSFDRHDLADYVAAFAAADGAVDYSRHDLNGDGRTGGATRDRFDLDVDLVADRWSDDQEADIQGIPIRFRDGDLTDLEVLCFYAHSDLYSGLTEDLTARSGFAAERCLDIGLELQFPATVSPGAPTPFLVRAVRPNGLVQPGVPIELQVSGGSISPGSGVTDAAGELGGTATLTEGAPELVITAVARTADGVHTIATKTVRAQPVLAALAEFGGSAELTMTANTEPFFFQRVTDPLGGTPDDGVLELPFADRTGSARYDWTPTVTGGLLRSARLSGSSRYTTSGAGQRGQTLSHAIVGFGAGENPVPYRITGHVEAAKGDPGPGATVLARVTLSRSAGNWQLNDTGRLSVSASGTIPAFNSITVEVDAGTIGCPDPPAQCTNSAAYDVTITIG